MDKLIGLKKDFPIFTRYPGLVYLDNAATSQKPRSVISAVSNFYRFENSNVHRGIYTLSQKATAAYEHARKQVAGFIGAASPEEIIFTGNATEAINLVALGYARKFLRPKDIVVISQMEHHSNYVPWLRLQRESGIKLVVLPLSPDFGLDYRSPAVSKLNPARVKLVALTHASNVLGTVNPVAGIIRYFKKTGAKAVYLVDAAQSVPHLPIDVTGLGCDFLAFSSHKMLGPSGVGVLWAKKVLLESMDPVFTGSHMISEVTADSATWAGLPDKFEAGTGRLEAVIGLGAAIDYLHRIGWKNIRAHEQSLTSYALGAFSRLKYVDLYGSRKAADRLGVFSFNVRGIHPHDVAEILNRRRVCVRAGHHCAQPLLSALGVSATVRASFYIYNTHEDIDALATGLAEVKKIFTR